MGWSHIITEAFCFGEQDSNKRYPCGQKYPTVFCLNNGHCPYLAYSETDEREAAKFVPLYLILKDRFHIWWEEILSQLSWYLWHRRFWKKKFDKWMEGKVIESPIWDKEQNKADQDFLSWLEEAKSEEKDWAS